MTLTRRVSALLGVRAFIAVLLMVGTVVLYWIGQKEAAASMMTLLTMAVTWLYKARTDREAK